MNLVFIIGSGRCGSTLVHEIISRHEDFGFISNIEDNFPSLNKMGKWNNYLYRTAAGNFTTKGKLRFAPSEAYQLISREVSPIYANSSRDLLASDVTPWLDKRFRRFFEERNNAQGRPYFLHKYTGWSRIGFFSSIFPDAKFIHIVRDGRAVANSWLQMPWWGGYRGPENWLWGPLPPDLQEEWQASDYSFPGLAAIGWKILMESFHQAETLLQPERYLKMRYEDVLADPRVSFEHMLKFIGVEWSQSFDAHFSRQVFRTDRSRAYECDLNPAQLSVVENSLGSLLDKYKYQ